MVDPDKNKGLYRKYFVQRLEDPAPTRPIALCRFADAWRPIAAPKKHEDCEYYILDLHHDRFAWPALEAYERACRDEYPELAADLRRKMDLRGIMYQRPEPAPRGPAATPETKEG